MANEYAPVAVLKDRMNITKADHDDALGRSLEAASRQIDAWTGRRFYLDAAPSARTYRPAGRVIRDLDGERLLVDDVGSEIGLLVETGSAGSWSTVAGFEYGPDNALIDGEPVTWLQVPFGYWYLGPAVRVRVTARWGWPSVPAAVAEAALLQAGRLYKRRESPEGVAGSAEWGSVRISRVDPDVAALIAPFVLPGFGG